MKLIKWFITVMLPITLFLAGCETEVNKPLKEDSSVPPKVTNIRVENLPGGAKITYTLPKDLDIAYVLAKYSLSSGEEKIAKSSVYKNYVELEGFSEVQEYAVNLYTVSRSEVESEPVLVKINPTTAPIHLVKESFLPIPTFGGVNLKFLNPDGIQFILHTHFKDSTGTWVDYDRYYSEAREGNYSVRGFESEPIDFRFYFTDQWQNSSDTTVINLTPLYEEEFDKSLWVDAALSDDTNSPRYGPLSQLWTPGTTTYFFVNPNIPGLSLPHWWTIDLGRKYIFGRMVIHLTSHNTGWMYQKGAPEQFEIWGSNERTTDWSKWTLLGDFTVEKVSGLPLGQTSTEDRAKILEGHEFQFGALDEGFRYVRFKAIRNFGNIPETHLLELTFFGQVVE